MSKSTVTLIVALVAVVVAVVTVRAGDDDRYRVVLDLDNAGGIRQGAPVETGGIPIGKVSSLTVVGDRVRAELELDHGHGPVGAGASVAIIAKNLLGVKSIQLRTGDSRRPLPSGVVLPQSQVTSSVDLDQVLDVLTPDTRARLQILIASAGTGLGGRGTQLNEFLRALPPSLDLAKQVVGRLVNDNATLGQVLERSDRLVAALTRERRPLVELARVAGDAAETVAQRKHALQRTLATAPATLDQLDRALTELGRTTAPLGTAADEIHQVSAPLRATLSQVEPFRTAAAPTLRRATTTARSLSELAGRATPVLTTAVPTLDSLRTLAQATPRLAKTVDLTVDDLMATLQGWSRAIQARDGLSHMFRAKVIATPDSLRTLLTRLGEESDHSNLDGKAPADSRSAASRRRGVATRPPVDDLIRTTIRSLFR